MRSKKRAMVQAPYRSLEELDKLRPKGNPFFMSTELV